MKTKMVYQKKIYNVGRVLNKDDGDNINIKNVLINDEDKEKFN